MTTNASTDAMAMAKGCLALTTRIAERERLPEPTGVITKLFPWYLCGYSLIKAFGWLDGSMGFRLNRVIKI
ncbi:MAG: hypothetical protein WA777_07075 [Rhodanobacter sp.]